MGSWPTGRIQFEVFAPCPSSSTLPSTSRPLTADHYRSTDPRVRRPEARLVALFSRRFDKVRAPSGRCPRWRSTHFLTTISTWRFIVVTSCTTAAWPAWTLHGSGIRRCSASEQDWKAPYFSACVTRLVHPYALRTLVALSTLLLESGSLGQLKEFCVHRSAYPLKAADPHTIAIPRLWGEAKAAMVEIQYDEYGSGRAASMHSTLFADTMTTLGLDSTYGAYLDKLPGPTLATVNLASMFGLHRRWRAAMVGHLAVFEMTSIVPMERYSRALARLGIGPEGRRFYDVHVAVDARHGAIARDRMVAGLIETEPDLGQDLLFGAAAVLLLEKRFARHLLDAWSTGSSSLLLAGMDLSECAPHHDQNQPNESPSCSTSGLGPRDSGL